MELKITRIGNSAGLVLPRELLARLRLEQGDVVIATEGPDGSLTLSRRSESDAKVMAAAERVMRKYAGVLRVLAK